MKIEITTDAPWACYVRLTPPEVERKGLVAKTKAVVPGSLMLDYDRDGKLVGIEILSGRLLARVPKILEEHGFVTDPAVRFDVLATAVADAAPAA